MYLGREPLNDTRVPGRPKATRATPLVDLVLEGQRDGLDWGNDAQVAAREERILARVAELKDHPAIVAWALGNEIDYTPPNEPCHSLVWKRLNHLVLTPPLRRRAGSRYLRAGGAPRLARSTRAPGISITAPRSRPARVRHETTCSTRALARAGRLKS